MTQETTKRREAHLSWLLAFAQSDLPKFRSREFKAVREAIKEIAVVEVVGSRTLFPERMYDLIRTRERQKGFELTHDETRFRKQIRLPTNAEVRTLQKWVVSLMEAARPPGMEHAPTITESGAVEDRVILPINFVQSARPKQLIQTNTFRRLAFYEDQELYQESCAELLSAFGQRVRRCEDPDCQTLFLRKGKKRHCSDVCALRLRMRTWRKQNREAYNAASRSRYQDKGERPRRERRINPLSRSGGG
jgi:hypothetical protein